MNRLTARSVKDLFLLLVALLLTLPSAAALAEDPYPVYGYTGEYDGKPHTITFGFDTTGFNFLYFVGGYEYNELPTFTDVGEYTIVVRFGKGMDGLLDERTATVTITQCTPKLYFTKESVVLQDDQDKCQLEWVYTGDGTLRFGSSDGYSIWVDDNGVVYRNRSNCGTSIYCEASETKTCNSVTAMCSVEHGISYI